MGSMTVDGAPAPPAPSPPTCKSLFWATELEGLTNIIAILLEVRTAELSKLCQVLEFIHSRCATALPVGLRPRRLLADLIAPALHTGGNCAVVVVASRICIPRNSA